VFSTAGERIFHFAFFDSAIIGHLFLIERKGALQHAGKEVVLMNQRHRRILWEHQMQLSREARIVAGLTLLAVPTIMYGGITLLGILTNDSAGLAPKGLALNETQWALFRAGHAHAGVWVILSLVLQVLLDSATLPKNLKWLARVAAPLAAVALSGAFFGLAFFTAFRWLLYFGATCMAIAVLLAGIGLLRRPNAAM
jgi:hypothetical protein